MTLTAAAWRYLANGSEPSDFAVTAVIELPVDVAFSEVERSLYAIAMRHEALHARYIGGCSPTYLVDDDQSPAARWTTEPVDLRRIATDWDLRDPLIDAIIEDEISRNLKRLGPPSAGQIAAAYVQRPCGTAFLVLTVHHLAVDGVSWNLIVSELEAELVGRNTVPTPETTCGQWVEAMRRLPRAMSKSSATGANSATQKRDWGWHVLKTLCYRAQSAARQQLTSRGAYPVGSGQLRETSCWRLSGSQWSESLPVGPPSWSRDMDATDTSSTDRLDAMGTVGWLADDYPLRSATDGGPANPWRRQFLSCPRHQKSSPFAASIVIRQRASLPRSTHLQYISNYWGRSLRQVGQLSLPDVAANRMEVGNASVADMAMQVRTEVSSDGMVVEWIMNSRSGLDASLSVIREWIAELSYGLDEVAAASITVDRTELVERTLRINDTLPSRRFSVRPDRRQ